LNHWYLDHSISTKVSGYAASPYKASRKRRFALPGGNKFGILDQLHGVLEPKDSNDKPIQIVINRLNIWILDCTTQSRGFWVESSNAWYKLKHPCPVGIPISVKLKDDLDLGEAVLPSQADLHLPLRAKFGLLSNILDIFSEEFAGEPHYYLNLHACRTPTETYQILSREDVTLENQSESNNLELAEPFDLELLRYSAGFIKRHLSNFHPNLTTNCEFVKGLSRFENDFVNSYNGLKWTAETYRDSAEQAEKRSNRTSFGELLSLEKIRPNKKLELDLSSAVNITSQRRPDLEEEMISAKVTPTDEDNQAEVQLSKITNKSVSYSSQYNSEARDSLSGYFSSDDGIDQLKVQKFISDAIITSTVPSFEYLIVCIQVLRASSKKVLKSLFKKSAEGGRMIFIQWFYFGLEEIHSLCSNGNVQITDDLAAVKLVNEIMLLICDFNVIKEAKQLEVLKNKFKVDWVKNVHKTLKFVEGRSIPNLSSSAKRALQHLEFITGESLPFEERHDVKNDPPKAQDTNPLDESPENQEERLRRQRINKMKEKAQGTKKKDFGGNKQDVKLQNERLKTENMYSENGNVSTHLNNGQGPGHVHPSLVLNQKHQNTAPPHSTLGISSVVEENSMKPKWSGSIGNHENGRDVNSKNNSSGFSSKKRSVSDRDNAYHNNEKELQRINEPTGSETRHVEHNSGWNNRNQGRRENNNMNRWNSHSNAWERDEKRSNEPKYDNFTRSHSGRIGYNEGDNTNDYRQMKKRRENNDFKEEAPVWQNENSNYNSKRNNREWGDRKNGNYTNDHNSSSETHHGRARISSEPKADLKSYNDDDGYRDSYRNSHHRVQQKNNDKFEVSKYGRNSNRNSYRDGSEPHIDERDKSRYETKDRPSRHDDGWRRSSETSQRGWVSSGAGKESLNRESRGSTGWNNTSENRNSWKQRDFENKSQSRNSYGSSSKNKSPQQSDVLNRTMDASKRVPGVSNNSLGRGRGRGRNLPAWMTSGKLAPVSNAGKDDISTIEQTVNKPSQEPSSIPHPNLSNSNSMGRGRGKNLPAWMTSGKVSQDIIRRQVEDAEDIRRNEPSAQEASLPPLSHAKSVEYKKKKSKKSNHHLGSTPKGPSHKVNGSTHVRNNHAFPNNVDNGQGRGRGRGRHVNLPAWMTANKN